MSTAVAVASEQEEREKEKEGLLGILEDKHITKEVRKEVQKRLDEIKDEETSERLHTYTHGILDIVIKNWDYFKANTVHLAWAMMQYELCHRACNLAGPSEYGCMDNPKYPVLDRGEELSTEDANLFYDAWATTVSNDYHFPDVNHGLPLEAKKNKTVQDWVDLLMDPNYRYTDQYPTEEKVIDWLFCVYGAGHGWNKDGFIDNTGPSGVGEANFAGYTTAEDDIREDLFQEIIALSRKEEILSKVMLIWSEHLIRASNDRPARETLDMQRKINYEFEKKSWKNKVRVPTHPLPELLKAAKYLCYFEELCRRSLRWTIEEWAEMRKKEVVVVNGFEMKVEDFRDDFYYPAFMMKYIDYGEPKDVKIDPRIDKYKHSFSKYWIQAKLEKNPDLDVDLLLDFMLNNSGTATGWNAIKNIFQNEKVKNYRRDLDLADEELQVNVMNARFQQLRKELNLPKLKKTKKVKPPKESSKFYPMCQYSNVWTMPKNADKSYVEAAVTHLRKIVADPLTDKYVLTYAFRVLKRLRRKPFDPSTDGVLRWKIMLKQKRALKTKIDSERYC